MKQQLQRELERIMKDRGVEKKSALIYLLLFFRLIGLGFNLVKTRLYLIRCNKLGTMVFTKGKPGISNKGKITIGTVVSIWSNIHKTRLTAHRGGSIEIGNNNFINGIFISASSKVKIGNNCKFGPITMIMDSDFHDIKDHSKDGQTSEIIIEDNVWIGARATILKGVRIGEGSIVAVGSVVTKSVPKNSIVAGVPAVVVKKIERG
ncbi:MAG: acyltransferase [Bacteroidota bacterium]|nr:acyltransferase [Bacteroidota bacterium]